MTAKSILEYPQLIDDAEAQVIQILFHEHSGVEDVPVQTMLLALEGAQNRELHVLNQNIVELIKATTGRGKLSSIFSSNVFRVVLAVSFGFTLGAGTLFGLGN